MRQNLLSFIFEAYTWNEAYAFLGDNKGV